MLARKRERDTGARVLFPVRLIPYEGIAGWSLFDPDTGVDVAREIRAFHIPDFTEWAQTHVFQEQFSRLVQDLEARKPPTG
jgi:hypothetical protein